MKTKRGIVSPRALEQKAEAPPKSLSDADHGSCDWQMCDNAATWLRWSPWGDLYVCDEHVREPLEDDS